jgi:hypothetical protein
LIEPGWIAEDWRDIGAGLAGWEAKLLNDIRSLGILSIVMLLP